MLRVRERRTMKVALLTGLIVGLLALPRCAEAQQAPRLPVIGYLSSAEASAFAPGRPFAYRLDKFREGLRELGYVEGQNVTVEYRYAEARIDRLPRLAAELGGLPVDVIAALGPAALRAAKNATKSIPIVAVDFESDPVAAGFVASIARPAGNITGAFLDQAELSGKWLELLKEAVPRLAQAAVLWDSATPSDQLNAILAAAKRLTVTLQRLEVRGPDDFDAAFAAATKNRAEAIVILPSPLMSRSGERLARLAATRRLPTISMFRESAVAGCLMSYGPNLAEGFRRLGSFTGRILRGARPEGMPVERPTRFEFVINLKTAKTLGLTIAPSLSARADEVIQ
jgi:putative ABC transport system substrate-binding protein